MTVVVGEEARVEVRLFEILSCSCFALVYEFIERLNDEIIVGNWNVFYISEQTNSPSEKKAIVRI